MSSTKLATSTAPVGPVRLSATENPISLRPGSLRAISPRRNQIGGACLRSESGDARPPRTAARLRRRVAGARVAAMLPPVGSRRLGVDPIIELLRVRERRRALVSRQIVFAPSDGRGCAGVGSPCRLDTGGGSVCCGSSTMSPPPSAADSLPVLPTLARRNDDVCDRLEVTRLAHELRDRERGARSVVAHERHGAASRLAVELKGAVRPVLGARDGADGVRHDTAQSSCWHIDIMTSPRAVGGTPPRSGYRTSPLFRSRIKFRSARSTSRGDRGTRRH